MAPDMSARAERGRNELWYRVAGAETGQRRVSRALNSCCSSVRVVCDAFDAMVAERPYRPAVAVPDALAELRRCAGTQFDPQIVEVFCAVLEASDDPQAEHATEGPLSRASQAGRGRDRLSV
jgi:hypothetical protein